MNFRYDIQGIRAIAVLFVFIFHLVLDTLPGGFIGVDIFFVISGFLVGGIILHKKELGDFKFLDFYLGRIKRIIPVFLLFLLFVSLIGGFVYLSSDISALRKNIIWAALFNSNNYLATLDNYFGASSMENPLLHTWTLSIEMQFYFLLPILLFLVKRRYVIPLCILIVLLLLIYSYYSSSFLNKKNEMYFSLWARIPEFLIGLIFVESQTKLKKIVNDYGNFLASVSIIGLIICAIFYNETMNFPGFWVVIPCILTGILLITTNSRINLALTNKFFAHIGELSYSIYLWHWAIMAFFRYYKNEISFNVYEAVFIIILTYILSYLSFTYIENIFRKLSNKIFFFRLSFVGLLLLTSVFALAKINKYVSPIPDEYSSPVFGIRSHAATFEFVENFGAPNRNDSICLIGDSHALVYKKILDVIGKKQNFGFSTISNNLYPNIPFIDDKDFKSYRYLLQYKNLLVPTDSLVKNSKIIILSSIWSKGITSLPIAFEKFANQIEDDQILVILGDFPVLNKNPLKINRGIVKNNNRPFRAEAVINDVPDFVKRIAKKNKNVVIMTFNYDKLIDDIPFYNDTIMYYDEGHLNLYGSTKVGENCDLDFLKTIASLKEEK